MANIILTVVVVLIATEITYRCKWKYRLMMMAHFATKTRFALLSPSLSDARKEILIFAYALRFATSAAMIIVYCLLLTIPLILSIIVSDDRVSYLVFLVSPFASAIMLGTSIGYFFIRKWLVSRL